MSEASYCREKKKTRLYGISSYNQENKEANSRVCETGHRGKEINKLELVCLVKLFSY